MEGRPDPPNVTRPSSWRASAGPIPRTRCNPWSEPKGPYAARSATMRFASDGPIRGSRSISSALATSRSTTAPSGEPMGGGEGRGGALPPRPLRCRLPPPGAAVPRFPPPAAPGRSPGTDALRCSRARKAGSIAPTGVCSTRILGAAPVPFTVTLSRFAPPRFGAPFPAFRAPRGAAAARCALVSCVTRAVSSPRGAFPRSCAWSRTTRPATPRTTMSARRTRAFGDCVVEDEAVAMADNLHPGLRALASYSCDS